MLTIISGTTYAIITHNYTHNGCRLPKTIQSGYKSNRTVFFGYVSSTKMSQSVPGGYKYTRVVFKIVSVLNKIKMSRKSKTTVKGFIYSVVWRRRRLLSKDGDKTNQQFRISRCQMLKSSRGGYKIL